MCKEAESHAQAKSKLKSIALVSAMFMVVEIAGGYLANSIAIMADALHLLSDISAYMISLYAIILSTKIAPKQFPYGYEKAQPLGALINVILIWIVTFELLHEATNRILAKEVVEKPLYMLLTSIFGLGCNIYIMKLLHSSPQSGHSCGHTHHKNQKNKVHVHVHSQHHKNHKCKESVFEIQQELKCFETQIELVKKTEVQNCESQTQLKLSHKEIQIREQSKSTFNDLNIQAAYIHILSDIILSIGVIISASLIYFFSTQNQWTYWQLADPLCTYFFSIIAIWSTIPIVKESITILLDGCTDSELVATIEKELSQKSIKIKQLKIWTINRGKNCATVKITHSCNQVSQAKQIFSKHKIDAIIETEIAKI